MNCKICQKKTKLLYKGIYDNRHGYPGKFNVYECKNCGFTQTKPQLTFRQLSEVYTKYYPKRDADIKGVIKATKNMPSKKEIKEKGLATSCHFQTKKGQKVLDVGCGTCLSLLQIKKLGGEAWGLDPDKNSANAAKKLKLKFHLGTIHNCKFPKNYFDLITASQVLEHEGDPVRFLKDCKKFLKQNGTIVLSFPNTGALYRRLWGKNWLHWHIPYHLNHFNKKSVEFLAKSANLKIVKIKTVTPNLWTILQIRSWINNPKIGQRDIMWDPNNTTDTGRKSNRREYVSGTLPYLEKLLSINRFIDNLGLGESFVVTLKPYGSSKSS